MAKNKKQELPWLLNLAEDVLRGESIAMSMSLQEIVTKVAEENGIKPEELYAVFTSDFPTIMKYIKRGAELQVLEVSQHQKQQVVYPQRKRKGMNNSQTMFVIVFSLVICIGCCILPFFIGGGN